MKNTLEKLYKVKVPTTPRVCAMCGPMIYQAKELKHPETAGAAVLHLKKQKQNWLLQLWFGLWDDAEASTVYRSRRWRAWRAWRAQFI